METGTDLGHTVEALKRVFQNIYSIELDDSLYMRAQEKFARHSHISILHGNSGDVLASLVERLGDPCLFWLDAHHSGGETARGPENTPILRELDVIFRHPSQDHVVLIDDAPDFTGKDGYPTIQEVEAFVRQHRPQWTFRVEHDIMRAHSSAMRIR